MGMNPGAPEGNNHLSSQRIKHRKYHDICN